MGGDAEILMTGFDTSVVSILTAGVCVYDPQGTFFFKFCGWIF